MHAPGIKVYISTQSNGIIDVSDDVTQGQMVRRSDGVSSFTFTLQNPFRKYGGVFTPNDRCIVMMKRISWLRTFTGYLNSVPLVTAWPSSVQITASCSLKRLQYWYWDPTLIASQNMVAQAMAAAKSPDDGGVTQAVLAIMQNVVGWPAEKVHIAGIPQGFSAWAYKIAKAVKSDIAEADALAQQFYATLGAGGIVGGTTGGGVTVSSGALKPGTYAGFTLSQNQCNMAVLIYNTCMQMGGTARDAVVGIECAMGESALGDNPLVKQGLPNGIVDAYGLFQQRPSAGWGTVAQVNNPTYAAKAFYQHELKVGNRDSMDPGVVVNTVQVAFNTAAQGQAYYDQWLTMATQVVNILANGQGASSLANTAGFSTIMANGKAGKANCTQFLGVALGLVESTPHIAYHEGNDSAPSVAVPTVLDCSSFVQWVIYHTLGTPGGCPRSSAAQSAWCQSSGQIISVQQGLNTPGALMFTGHPGSSSHVEVSCGTGKDTVGAHHSGTYAGVISSGAAYWGCAGLPPGIDYSAFSGAAPAYKSVPAGSALSSGATIPVSAQGLQTSPASSQPWYNPSDPFEKLFGSSPWFPTFDGEDAAVAAVLTGPRALLNDQPLLPFLKNLFGSVMRSYCSGPNGDLIAWFPDYYGIWGTAAIMRVEPIELQDFTVYWDDSSLVTHQYTVAPPAQQLDLGSGQAASITVPATGQTLPLETILALTTTGIASVDIPAIMYALFGLEPTAAAAQKFITYVYNRFGARPDLQQLPGVIGPQGEFFSALFLFMRSWAYQYNADVPLTFMPELWPGMLLQIPTYGFQAYVTTVTHSFQMGEGGFFSTSVNIAAPARLPGSGNDSGGQLIGLPIAGGLTSGTNLPVPGQGTGGS
ncbi:MAG: peptidoglycan endopeptidase [Actinomycetia bacterium]|nr:peptidoglycan endopeptidase [Actinomycetes bacterium]